MTREVVIKAAAPNRGHSARLETDLEEGHLGRPCPGPEGQERGQHPCDAGFS